VAKPRRSRRPRNTLLILLLASITIITLDARGGLDRITSGVQTVATDAFSPVRSGVDDIIEPIGSFLAGSVHYGAVEQANQKLRTEINQLKAEKSQQAITEQQMKQLSALLNLPFLGNLQSVPAEVTNYDTSDFAATINISKGRSDGVTVGMPVVDASGLVGQVVQAGHHTATVRLITDGQSVVGAIYGGSTTTAGSTAILDGTGWGKSLAADLVPSGTPLPKGELFATSGLQDAVYPAGIPVARVVSSRSGVTASQETVILRPVVDLAHLRYVSVLLWGPPS
jgi:rod shape-determining protein MreC